MLQAILILIGLSLDSFIVMMQRGANMKNLTAKKLFSYTFVFTCIAVVMFLIGYGGSSLLEKAMDDRIEMFIATQIIFFVGVFQIVKSLMKKEFVEGLDHGFNISGVFHQALHTSIDVALIGAAFGLYGSLLSLTTLVAFIAIFVSVLIALLVGYHYGAQYQKVYGVIGGVLMVVFSIYMIVIMIVR